ncbi:hypothetical protein GGR58DRAFT_476079 [Xylaria digitata]|nr:hypothetical protein GGR58DRAFT_476079 [Xylaria digitata]
MCSSTAVHKREGSKAENRSGGIDPETPRRYSDMMTYQPATFRDLPVELRLMI